MRGGEAGRRVLDGDAVGDVDAELLGGGQVRLGMRLRVLDGVARDDDVERVERDGRDDVVGHRADRHGHERGGHGCLAQRLEQLARAGPPRHAVLVELLAHPRREARDDRVGLEVDALRLEERSGLPEAAADELERVVVAPGAAEGLDELLFGSHPVAFGVDEGAVHVPEDGGGEASSHNPQVYGHGLLWRGTRRSGAGSGAPGVNQPAGFEGGRLLVVAFEGWNDAGEAATGAAKLLVERLGLVEIAAVDPELYFDYQFTRPTIVVGDDGIRRLEWPGAAILGPERRARR